MTKNTAAIASATLFAAIIVPGAVSIRAEEPVTVSTTIKDHQFDPAEIHAPPGKPILIAVKNLDEIASEFESDSLHVEKVIPPGGEGKIRVRPLEPGRYNFFDDFHHATQGYLVVP
jgi:hypothetical protein